MSNANAEIPPPPAAVPRAARRRDAPARVAVQSRAARRVHQPAVPPVASARSAASGSAPPTSSTPAPSSKASRRRWSCSPPTRPSGRCSCRSSAANVAEMTGAAQWLVERGLADGIDINMGCPVRKVVRTGGGSAMMCDTTGAPSNSCGRSWRRCRCRSRVKMRLGWDDDNLTAPYFAREFEKVGVAAVTIHGRTREQGFSRRRQPRRHPPRGRGGRADAGLRQRRRARPSPTPRG